MSVTAIVCTHSYISCRVREYQRDTTRRNTNTVMIRSNSYDTVLYGAKIGDVDIRISTPIASIISPPLVKMIPHIDELSFFLSPLPFSLSILSSIHSSSSSITHDGCLCSAAQPRYRTTHKMPSLQFYTLHRSTITTTQHAYINCAPCDACIYFLAKSPPPPLLICVLVDNFILSHSVSTIIFIYFYTFHGVPSPSPFFFFPFP